LEKEKSNKKLGVILGVVIVALVAVIGVLAWKLTHQPQPEVVEKEPEVTEDANALAYDSSAVATDEDSLRRAVDDLAKKAAEGTMALEMRTTANSTDGENFTCTLANAAENRYDMYMTIYLDDTGEEIYKSGLIPLGMQIETFKTKRKLDPGTYETTLVYNQVEKDRATLHSKVSVGLTLTVK